MNDWKQATERAVFERFAEAAGLAVRTGSIQQPDPPDICGEVAGLGPVGFEPVQVDDSGDLARMGALFAVDRLWAQVVASLPAAAHERISRAGITADFVPGMSTTEVALTVHLVMPQPPEDDKFLHEVSHELQEHFEIGHVTIQIEHGDAECQLAPAEVV